MAALLATYRAARGTLIRQHLAAARSRGIRLGRPPEEWDRDALRTLLDTPQPCPTCEGTGRTGDRKVNRKTGRMYDGYRCRRCKGEGKVRVSLREAVRRLAGVGVTYGKAQREMQKQEKMMMTQTIIWVDCGCCGRTHELLPLDCRAFSACPKCGDCYLVKRLATHVQSCDGKPLSEFPPALFEATEG